MRGAFHDNRDCRFLSGAWWSWAWREVRRRDPEYTTSMYGGWRKEPPSRRARLKRLCWMPWVQVRKGEPAISPIGRVYFAVWGSTRSLKDHVLRLLLCRRGRHALSMTLFATQYDGGEGVTVFSPHTHCVRCGVGAGPNDPDNDLHYKAIDGSRIGLGVGHWCALPGADPSLRKDRAR